MLSRKLVQVVSNDLLQSATKIISGQGSQRFAHTDLVAPNFDKHRYSNNLDETKAIQSDGRKAFDYFCAASTIAGSAILVKGGVRGIVQYLQPNKNIRFSANLEIDLAKIPEGKHVIVTWNSKPVFIRNRPEAEMKEQLAVDVSDFRDPVPDVERFHDMKWQVMLGVCTHLGCVPIGDKGDFGGFYCPCHGSHYDIAGRIRKGPAPRNLEVPPYKVMGDTMLIGTC